MKKTSSIFTLTTLFRLLQDVQHKGKIHIFRIAGFQVWHPGYMLGLHQCEGCTTIVLRTYNTITSTSKTWRVQKPKADEGANKDVNSLSLCKQRRLKESLDILRVVNQRGICADSTIYASLLHSCARMEALAEGKWVHASMIKTGHEMDFYIGNHLVNMYAKCGNIINARQVFDKMSKRNVVSWTAMISGYDQHRCGQEALILFCQMLSAGFLPNQFTFSSVLSACASLDVVEQGRQVHAHTLKIGFESNVFVGNALVTMYAKCGNIDDARQVFSNMPEADEVSWNAMIAGYGQHGFGDEALRLFCKMQQAGLMQNHFTLASVLTACAGLARLAQGIQIHAHIVKSGFNSDVFVGSALVDMYAKCYRVEDALKVFDELPERDVVSWNAMIECYSQNDQGEEALKLFGRMQGIGMKPDLLTVASILGVCTNLAVLEHGKQVHANITKNGFEEDVCVGNALIDMYAKCGSMMDALKKFDKMPERTVVSWTMMIAGFAQHGHGKEAIQLFEQMQRAGMKPNCITFICILSACSRVGLLDEGRHYFNSMRQDHGIAPTVEHYVCMVDLLGRAGHFDEAVNFIKEIPFEPGALVWQALLGACRIHGNMELGKRVAECILQLEPQYAPTYVLLSNIYAAAGKWDEVHKVRKMMKDRGAKKEPGCSWVEVKNRVHIFVTGDRSHRQTEEIYAKLEELTWRMEDAGYVPAPWDFCAA